MTNHQNDERTVRCPVEGCDATPLARGINLHINRSSGDGHGPRGEIPDHISLDDLETVGERNVEMDYPEDRDTETHARLCPYCNQTFAGEQGVMIHLGQTAGRKNHPTNPKDRHEPGDFPRVEVDAQGNIRQVTDGPNEPSADDRGDDAVPVARVFSLIADLLADGESVAAHRVRKQLLGIDAPERPVRTAPAHNELFNALLDHYTTDNADQSVSATLNGDGITIACRGETARYTAEEARDDAAGLADILNDYGDDGELRDLIEFMRYAATRLDEEPAGSGLHEEFQHWR